MNDRIKELAEQAGFQYIKDEGIGWAGNYNSSLPKFAELIVRECVDVLETEIHRLTEYGKSLDNENYKADVELCISKCIDNIMNLQEHFGIKK